MPARMRVRMATLATVVFQTLILLHAICATSVAPIQYAMRHGFPVNSAALGPAHHLVRLRGGSDGRNPPGSEVPTGPVRIHRRKEPPMGISTLICALSSHALTKEDAQRKPNKKVIKLPPLKKAISAEEKSPEEVAKELRQKKAEADAKYAKLQKDAEKSETEPADVEKTPKKGLFMTRSESYSALNEEILTEVLEGEGKKADPATLEPGKTSPQPRPVSIKLDGPLTDDEAQRAADALLGVASAADAPAADPSREQDTVVLAAADEEEKVEEPVDPMAKHFDALAEFMGGNKRYNVVIASSEVSPYSKSGGLADVAAKLSVALSQLGHRVMTVAPSYRLRGQTGSEQSARRNYEGPVGTGVGKEFQLYGGNHGVHYTHQWIPTDTADPPNPLIGVDRVFVQNAGAFERAGMYGDPGGHDYFDNLCRFSLLCWAALEAPLVMPPVNPFGQDVVFIANDWQTSLLPMILASHYRRWRVFENARCLFTIHNMGYPGNFPNPQMYNYDLEDPRETPKWSFCDLGLADNLYYDLYKYTFPEELRGDKGVVDDGECARLLKGAIHMADRVVTVSPTYRNEIMTDQGGWGMHEDVRSRQDRLDGILNGIDTVEWDPENDPHIAGKFSATNMTGKATCKRALQEALGLQQNPDAPIVAFIGRLAPQKGIDVLEAAHHWLMGGDNEGVLEHSQLVMMGSGQHEYAEFMRKAEAQYKGRICGYVGFSPEMEHAIIAGADLLVMPSRYEPCGLPQMYAQRYGTIPIVHATGGLQDSVDQFEAATKEQNATGTGWKFGNCDQEGFKWGLWHAIRTYKKEPGEWRAMMKRAMLKDFSWRASAEKYVQLMDWATMDAPRHQPWQFQH